MLCKCKCNNVIKLYVILFILKYFNFKLNLQHQIFPYLNLRNLLGVLSSV